MLVKLYELPGETALRERLAAQNTVVRRAMAYEKEAVTAWVGQQFGQSAPGWKSECDVAFSRSPITCRIAIRENALLGFACHDVTARNVFGPIGIGEGYRLSGLGSLLLLSTLRGMREQGYAYAIIGYAGAREFFEKSAGAIAITGSVPGMYPPESLATAAQSVAQSMARDDFEE